MVILDQRGKNEKLSKNYEYLQKDLINGNLGSKRTGLANFPMDLITTARPLAQTCKKPKKCRKINQNCPDITMLNSCVSSLSCCLFCLFVFYVLCLLCLFSFFLSFGLFFVFSLFHIHIFLSSPRVCIKLPGQLKTCKYT